MRVVTVLALVLLGLVVCAGATSRTASARRARLQRKASAAPKDSPNPEAYDYGYSMPESLALDKTKLQAVADLRASHLIDRNTPPPLEALDLFKSKLDTLGKQYDDYDAALRGKPVAAAKDKVNLVEEDDGGDPITKLVRGIVDDQQAIENVNRVDEQMGAGGEDPHNHGRLHSNSALNWDQLLHRIKKDALAVNGDRETDVEAESQIEAGLESEADDEVELQAEKQEEQVAARDDEHNSELHTQRLHTLGDLVTRIRDLQRRIDAPRGAAFGDVEARNVAMLHWLRELGTLKSVANDMLRRYASFKEEKRAQAPAKQYVTPEIVTCGGGCAAAHREGELAAQIQASIREAVQAYYVQPKSHGTPVGQSCRCNKCPCAKPAAKKAAPVPDYVNVVPGAHNSLHYDNTGLVVQPLQIE